MSTQDTGNRAAVSAAVMVSAVAALCEYMSVLLLPVKAVMGLIFLSFVFDMVFTALFVSDAAEAVKRHKSKFYMLHGRGLIDLCGSIPVLFLYSAPSVLIMAAGSESAVVHFLRSMVYFWSTLGITGVLRVSRLTRIASLPLISGSGMTERHITFLCTVICGAALPVAPLCVQVMRMAGANVNAFAASGFIAAFMLFLVLAAVIAAYSRHFENTVSSILDILDRGFRRREFYLKVKVSEEQGEDGVSRIASFYNESYLPAKIRQNINNPEPAAYRVPEEEVKNFIRNR